MYLTIGSIGGKMTPSKYGVNDGWGGPRSTSTLVQSFEADDNRSLFFSEGANVENTDLTRYQDGYGVIKFTNLLSTDWVIRPEEQIRIPTRIFLYSVWQMYT